MRTTTGTLFLCSWLVLCTGACSSFNPLSHQYICQTDMDCETGKGYKCLASPDNPAFKTCQKPEMIDSIDAEMDTGKDITEIPEIQAPKILGFEQGTKELQSASGKYSLRIAVINGPSSKKSAFSGGKYTFRTGFLNILKALKILK